MEKIIELEGSVYFKFVKGDILLVGEILSEIIFNEKGKFQGFENYVRDEVPYIFTKRYLGVELSISQNPECPSEFCLELTDENRSIKGLPLEALTIIDVSRRLKESVMKYPDFKILED